MWGKSQTKEQAYQKLKHYCGYQDRCHAEVRRKLFELGVKKKDAEEIMAMLIEEDYLNEERFAINYASGKMRIKQWGKVKIEHELLSRGISQYCIKKALSKIDEEEYCHILGKMAAKKYESLAGEAPFVARKKTIEWLMHRGFEKGLIDKVLEKVK